MKEILISIQPQWVEKILNGEKTVEIRKTMPKCELPVKVYIYCTKSRYALLRSPDKTFEIIDERIYGTPYVQKVFCELNNIPNEPILANRWNGKVVGEFTLNKVEKIKFDTPMSFNSFNSGFGFNDTRYNFNLDKSCLTEDELFEYLGEATQIKGEYHLTYELNGYAWHIEDLILYNKPKELSEFGLRRASPSWQYLEKVEE